MTVYIESPVFFVLIFVYETLATIDGCVCIEKRGYNTNMENQEKAINNSNVPLERDRSLKYPFDKPTKEMNSQEYGEFLEWVAFDWPEKSVSIELRETKLEIEDYIERIHSFEAKYNLGELHSIIDLNPKDAPNHPLREPARKALIPIVAQLNILAIHRDRGNISVLQYKDFIYQEYMRLSRAVGMINNGKIDHNR